MDIWSKKKRSEVMSRIRSKNTKPEIFVRSMIHNMGYRFRIHRRDLPGCPDLVFPKYRSIIFVQGCFWHLHKGCRDGTIPKTDHEKWKAKLERNVMRDKQNFKKLKDMGWKVLVIWECEVEKKIDKVEKKVRKFLTN
ncbi:MAG TPA: DNA mismatch endonuclease Vsr [Nitrospirae bacterium]|nr:very short patch repair protein [bacterium BMS3Abin06]HDH12137.1 DNA mismatch endonuclease Vsr [Nitrospirota bacterium]HDZ02357.1 DNA mismatch endonuclease Vsr [Nitrospirota bacterium]